MHRPLNGLAAAAAAFAVFPIQWLRGWGWGGTLEINSLGDQVSDPPVTIFLGIVHSAYTFIKTALWLGGLSVFRPPIWLLVVAGFLICVWLFALRPVRRPRNLVPHGAAFLVAAAGFVAFAIGKRQMFGVWGAVGGWYLWGWYPWLAVLASDLAARESRFCRLLRSTSLAWILAANISWFIRASTLYGLP
jgi:hypothetical protein